MISRAVASLADAALLLPASCLLLLVLVARREGVVAAGWASSLGLAGAATILSKLLFRACGHVLTELDVFSPSGHTAFATIFYGALALMLSAGRPPWVGRVLGAGTALFVAAVCISRVRTGAHSGEETAIGVGIGLLALGLFAAVHARAGRPWMPVAPLAAGLATMLVMLGGLHFTLEGRIGRAARHLSASLDICTGSDRPDGIGFLRVPD